MMLAHDYKEEDVIYPCFVQPKLNGIRARWHPAEGYITRQDNVWSDAMQKALPLIDCTIELDGELYVHDWTLQRINSCISINREEPLPDTWLIEYHIFDCIDLTKDQVQRFDKLLEHGPTPSDRVKYVETKTAASKEEAALYVEFYASKNYEGIMYRMMRGMYSRRRTKMLLKRKLYQRLVATVVGTEEGEGECANMVGALQCKFNDITFKVGTGMSLTERMQWVSDPPAIVVVQYVDLSEDGIPLNPSLLEYK